MSSRSSRGVRGVTLIELMVVVVVLAIIATIAVPSYRSYVQRAQRADAKTGLLRVRAAQEKFFLQNNSYADQAQLTALGYIGPSEHGHFTIDLPNVTKTTFTARALAIEGQLNDAACRTFTVDEQGQRLSKNASGADSTAICWR
ncbi:MAG TPA: type IV pilin protein [Steroidobacteraceae bacterium]|nr:type IV pilin protein [Steroidobacteraceae bacterium]